ncbi:hypothetical protein ACSBR1_025580 [Camellia fascicularis]
MGFLEKNTTTEESIPDFGIGKEDDGEEFGDFVRGESDYDDSRDGKRKKFEKDATPSSAPPPTSPILLLQHYHRHRISEQVLVLPSSLRVFKNWGQTLRNITRMEHVEAVIMRGGQPRFGGLRSTLCISSQIVASPQTCAANIGKGYGDDWEGEFFPGIPKIKYESPSSKSPLAFKWYNAEEEILGKKMSVFPFSLLSLSPLSQLLLLFLLLRWCLFLGKILGFLLFNLVFLLVVFVVVSPYILCSSQEKDILTAPMEEKEQKALYYAIEGFVEKWWNGSDLYPDPCGWTPI